jgi:DNA-directed RNA polymerase subunit alpha
MLKIENNSKNINVSEEIFSPFRSKYTLSPLYKGYGHTIGNALRRILLSSIPGCAIKGVKIDGVVSEFSVIKGVKESVLDILLNVKSVLLKSSTYGNRKMTLSVHGPKVVTATDIMHDSTLEIINKQQVIAHITDESSLNIEFLVDTGEGYIVSDDIDKSRWPVGFLAIDALYSPIKNVSYSVEDTMVGRVTNFDKLVIDLETNGCVEAKDMMSYAVELMVNHLTPLLSVGNRMHHLKSEIEVEEVNNDNEEISVIPDIRIEELDLSVRSYNCLKKSDIHNLKDLVKLTEKELLNIKNLGKSSLAEISAKLEEFRGKK